MILESFIRTGIMQYTQEGTSLLRFKADVYGYKTIAELEDKAGSSMWQPQTRSWNISAATRNILFHRMHTQKNRLAQYQVPTDLTPEQTLTAGHGPISDEHQQLQALCGHHHCFGCQ